MRKLLVASQKGGVGKTTTSMNLAAAAALSGTRVLLLDADPLSNISMALNLAEHPHRQSLRQAGIDLPGALVTNMAPGLDVLSPYDEGRCSDADFDHLLQVLSAPSSRQCYGCMIVDAPPFLGANPEQLVGSCDEYLLVMRAEAMAYRTLPAFLELVQRSSRNGHTIQMRGILLTLPEGEEPGCRWERELRGRFGARILSEVIPHDETITKALRLGQISSHLHPDSPAARQYRQLAGKLELAEEPCPAAAAEQITQALREAATAVLPVIAAASGDSGADAPPETPKEPEEVDRFAPPPEAEPLTPAVPAINRVRGLGRSGEIARPVRSERLSSSDRIRAVSASDAPAAAPDSPAPAAPAPQAEANNPLGQLWPLWILLGAVLGGGLRFLPPSPSLLPIVVGLSVAVIVVVVLRAMAQAQEPGEARAAERARGRSRSRNHKKTPGRTEARKDSARLASHPNGAAKKTRHDPHAN